MVAPATITKRPVKRAATLYEAARATDGVDHMDQRRTQHTSLTRARIHDRLVTSTCISDVTWMNWHLPQEQPTCTSATQHSNSLGPIARHGGIDKDRHREAD